VTLALKSGSSGEIAPTHIAPVASSIGVPFVIGVAFIGAGPADATVYAANAPFSFEIMRMDVRVALAQAATIVGRTAAAGGGSVLTDTMSLASTGLATVSTPIASIATVAAGGSLYLNRSATSNAGKAYLHCVRI
jgi:hypothetical protein